MKNILLVFFLFCYCSYLAQSSDTMFYAKNKKCFAYSSLKEANQIHMDSVKGIRIFCDKFIDFPYPILKYKRLKYIQIGHCSLEKAKDDSILTKKDIEKYKAKEEKFYQKNKSSDFGFSDEWYYKNKITKVPNEISELKELERFDLNCEVSKPVLKKLLNTLPQVNIFYLGIEISSPSR